MKVNKVANDIPIASIKQTICNEDFMKEMVRLYHSVWDTNMIPKQWGHSKLVALWKGASKGCSDNPKAYRPIQIGSSLCKILVITIINRIQLWYESQLTDQQQGFRVGRGTADSIYITKRIHQITDKMR